MTTTGGSSNSSSSSGNKDKDKERVWDVNPTQNLTGSFSSGSDSRLSDKTVPQAHKGSDDDGKSIYDIRGPGSVYDSSETAQLLYPNEGGGGSSDGRIGTTVVQRAPENPGVAVPTVDGAETTNVNQNPRSDFSVVLAGQTGTKPSRLPSRSNNFVSLAGGAGGLGRKTAEAKRTLIGGA